MIDLNKQQIQDRFDFASAAAAIRAAYIAFAEGQVQAPPVTYLGFPEASGDCHVKSAHIAGDEAFVIKIATGFYDNPSKGLPSSNGMNLVFSAKTGAPLALLRDEGWLTDIRTGIGGALATEALAVPGFERVLIVGAGLQARHQADCLQRLVGDRALRFTVWGRRSTQAERTVKDLQNSGLNANGVEDLADACKNAQVIITATPSRTPLVSSAWVRPGTHITAIGADAPEKQELDARLVADADVLVCDSIDQCLDHGESRTCFQQGHLKQARALTLGSVLADNSLGRASQEQITLADLTGLAAQDVAISLSVLKR